jgi:hypothetical protein
MGPRTKSHLNFSQHILTPLQHGWFEAEIVGTQLPFTTMTPAFRKLLSEILLKRFQNQATPSSSSAGFCLPFPMLRADWSFFYAPCPRCATTLNAA